MKLCTFKPAILLTFPVFILFISMRLLASPFEIQEVTNDLNYPWGMTFVNDEVVLVTEKPGKLKRIHLKNAYIEDIQNLPNVAYAGQGGLLDVVLDPDFDRNNRLYLSYSKPIKKGYTTAVAVAHLKDNQLHDLTDILITKAESSNRHHYGSRLVFDHRGLLYVTVGDRGHRERAQDLTTHMGKVLRIHSDGRIPKDNPFVDVTFNDGQRALPEIFTFGHRNPQGMVFDSVSKQVWIHEHGPRGGDELNLLQAGKNYGWPVITYGREYSGFSITDETHRVGMQQPVWYWDPSIAPSGLAIYRGNTYRSLQESFLIGALKFRQLYQVQVDSFSKLTNKVLKDKVSPIPSLSETAFFSEMNRRIRDVEVSPDGMIYLLTDSSNGQLIKLYPKESD
jgi:glucose/arabinose dehydrogenase